MAKHTTTIQKRFKLLYTFVNTLNNETGCDYSPLLEKLNELSIEIDKGNKQAPAALCFYEDNILSILSNGHTVSELN